MEFEISQVVYTTSGCNPRHHLLQEEGPHLEKDWKAPCQVG